MQVDEILGQFDFQSIDTCESCLVGKMTKAPFSKTGERASVMFGIIHNDVCGPMNICTWGGYEYLVMFTDNFSRYVYVHWRIYK